MQGQSVRRHLHARCGLPFAANHGGRQSWRSSRSASSPIFRPPVPAGTRARRSSGLERRSAPVPYGSRAARRPDVRFHRVADRIVSSVAGRVPFGPHHHRARLADAERLHPVGFRASPHRPATWPRRSASGSSGRGSWRSAPRRRGSSAPRLGHFEAERVARRPRRNHRGSMTA